MQTVETDYTTLQKGDVLSTEHVEQATGVGADDHKRFPFALMSIADQVRRDLTSVGKHFTVATRKQQVVILTDPEASEYNDRAFDASLSRAKRRNFDMQQVNVTKLDDRQRKHHERACYEQSMILQAVAAKRAELRLNPSERTTPTLG
jgi:RNA-binding protein YlmH